MQRIHRQPKVGFRSAKARPFAERKATINEPQVARGGNTLAEVLMSLLAFGIGAVAVATLFPTAVLQSIQATKLTKGTIHRQNAESMVRLFPRNLRDDPDLNNNYRQHYDPADPNYAGDKYIIDPLGWERIRQDTSGTPAQQLAAANQFGQAPSTVFLPRYNGLNDRSAAININTARQLVTSPDSWTQPFDVELTVTASTATTATVTGVDPSDLAEVQADTVGKRITLFDGTARFSHVRTITGIAAGGVVSWTTPLPTGFTPETARIETQDEQFTWLLTVRNANDPTSTAQQPSGKANVDVVIFFRRAFSATNERVYTLTAGGGQGRYIVATGGVRPFLKKGSWMCDVTNARWYRIQRIFNDNSPTPEIVLEGAPSNVTHAIFMPGVVDVFSLGAN